MAQSINDFLTRRRPRWARLEELIQSLERGALRRLGVAEIQDLGRSYREAAADLARLRTLRPEDSLPGEMEDYLNQLVARAYGQIYRNPPPTRSRLWRFLRSTFPLTFRRSLPWFLAALGLFLCGFVYGLVVSLTDEAFIPLVVPLHLIQTVEDGKVWFDSILAVKPLASSRIMTNNISVSFLAFAFGMTFGVGTVYLLIFNGLLLGTLAGLCHSHGLDTPFWSFVLPHGVIELTAIFIAGAGGLLLATALFLPGDFTRKDALVARSRQAVRLVLGCVPLLVVAGIIEGFFSPLPVWPGLKFMAAAVLLLLLIGYLLSPGPDSSRAPNQALL
jgi:uncharacterized membrane protein SpoIIM required for sporulation